MLIVPRFHLNAEVAAADVGVLAAMVVAYMHDHFRPGLQ